MTRTEIKDYAKKIVAHHGAYTILEFGAEEFMRPYGFDGTEEEAALVEAEAIVQANRVLDFLNL